MCVEFRESLLYLRNKVSINYSCNKERKWNSKKVTTMPHLFEYEWIIKFDNQIIEYSKLIQRHHILSTIIRQEYYKTFIKSEI